MICNKVFLGTQWDPIGFYIIQYNDYCIIKLLKIVKYNVDDLKCGTIVLQHCGIVYDCLSWRGVYVSCRVKACQITFTSTFYFHLSIYVY
jgi:hypothetical protein